MNFGLDVPDERTVPRHRSTDQPPNLIKSCMGENTLMIGTNCGPGGRLQPEIAWAKLRALRDGAAIAIKKLWS